ncbi:MAG TPA: hypothetical protein VGD56_10620 [Gemmatirosa sp.]
MTGTLPDDPHFGQPIRHAGARLADARVAVVMVHGRGAAAEGILTLAPALTAGMPDGADDVAFLAPQAAGGTWYPYSFLAPLADNEPGLSSGLRAIGRVLDAAAAAGVPAARTVLLGFSQGACLATEYAARHARRYGGVAALSGGVIGPEGTPRGYAGALDGTPVFLGCDDADPHIPAARVRESALVLEALRGDVVMRLYRGVGHAVIADELAAVRAMLAAARSGTVHAGTAWLHSPGATGA